MKEGIDELIELRARCFAFEDSLSTALGVPKGKAPVSAQAMLGNHATLAAETLSYYYEVWGSLTSVADPKKTLQDNRQRVVDVLRALLIFSLSSLEYVAKVVDQESPAVLNLDRTKRIYLSKIMRASRDASLIDSADFDRWKALIELRNAIVHNNAIADVDLQCVYPDGTTVTLQRDVMIYAPTLLFPVRLTAWAAEAFGRWSEEFARRAHPSP